MGSITVMGTKVDLHQTKAERWSLKNHLKNRSSWVNMNDSRDTDPELRRMRSDIKEGVLSYSNYMNKQFGNVDIWIGSQKLLFKKIKNFNWTSLFFTNLGFGGIWLYFQLRFGLIVVIQHMTQNKIRHWTCIGVFWSNKIS